MRLKQGKQECLTTKSGEALRVLVWWRLGFNAEVGGDVNESRSGDGLSVTGTC